MLISILSALPTPTGCILMVWLVESLIQEWGTFQRDLVLAGVCRLGGSCPLSSFGGDEAGTEIGR